MEDKNCILILNNEKYLSSISINDKEDSSIIRELAIKTEIDNNIIKISITNNSMEEVEINSLELVMAELDIAWYPQCIINPENPKCDITANITKEIKERAFVKSYLFCILQRHEDYPSLFYGFLSSHITRNYISLERKKGLIRVKCIYDFVSQKIKPNEEISLDKIYFDSENNYLNLLNRYSDVIEDKFLSSSEEAKGSLLKYEADNMFFTEKASKDTIIKGAKTLIIDGKKLYPIDITKEEVKQNLINKYLKIKETSTEYVFIKSIMPYIDEISKLKKFNPYSEINSLIRFIRMETGLKLVFDDCPVGLALGNMDIFSWKLCFEENSRLINKFINRKKESCLSYNYIIKTILGERIFKTDFTFQMRNKKINETMEIMSGSLNSFCIENKKLKEIALDIQRDREIIAHSENTNLFAILRYGKRGLYIAIFNFSNTKKRFYWDTHLNCKEPLLDGDAFDVFTGNSYLISSGKIHVKNINPRDCCLIIRPLNNDIVNKEKLKYKYMKTLPLNF